MGLRQTESVPYDPLDDRRCRVNSIRPHVQPLLDRYNLDFRTSHGYTVQLLKYCPQTIPVLVDWVYKAWSTYDPFLTREDLTHRYRQRLHDDRMPITVVALRGKEPVGTFSLRESVEPDLNSVGYIPWLGSHHIAPTETAQSLDQDLLEIAVRLTACFGYPHLYVYVSDSARAEWYVKQGASVVHASPSRDHTVTILSFLCQID